MISTKNNIASNINSALTSATILLSNSIKPILHRDSKMPHNSVSSHAHDLVMYIEVVSLIHKKRICIIYIDVDCKYEFHFYHTASFTNCFYFDCNI